MFTSTSPVPLDTRRRSYCNSTISKFFSILSFPHYYQPRKDFSSQKLFLLKRGLTFCSQKPLTNMYFNIQYLYVYNLKKENMEERWRPLKRFKKPKIYDYQRDEPDVYLFEVSNLWRIKSYRYNKPKIITNIHPNTSWYLMYQFRYNGKRCSYLVHKLVMEAFHWLPPDWYTVNHENCIKTDNRLDNLTYMTHQENIDHARKNWLIINTKWKDHYLYGKTWRQHHRSQPVLQLDKDYNIIKEWESANLAAKALGTNRTNISRAIRTNKSAVWHYWKKK